MSTRKRAIKYDGPALYGETKYVSSIYAPSNPAIHGRITSKSTSTQTYSGTRYLTGIQITESSSSPSWKSRKSGSFKGDYGNEFFTQKKYAKVGETTRVYLENVKMSGNEQIKYEYTGPLLAVTPQPDMFPPSLHSSKRALEIKGATAISRCAPTNPAADLSVFLGELVKEGLPSMIGATLKKWRSLSPAERKRAIGSEYLNVEFGWKPIVNDLGKLSQAIVHADKVLRQYQRDSNKLIRRGYEFPPESSESTIVYNSGRLPFVATSVTGLIANVAPTGVQYRHRKVERKQWFKGAFTYYIPQAGGSRSDEMARQVQQAKKLLGLSLTPSTVWNLAPWSWALDWFANTGDVLENIDAWAVDGLVLRYGYMMETTIVTDTYTYSGETGFNPSNRVPGSLTFVTETKQRIKATPFGFGLNFDGFSNRQLAIIAALGLTKS